MKLGFAEYFTLFIIYGFIGWILETALVSFQQKRFVNRGFLRGPVLPLYGFGAFVILIAAEPIKDSPAAVFFAGAAVATALEYAAGLSLEAVFKVKYWDYSNHKFNFQGRVCLDSTLAWGAMALFLVCRLHGELTSLTVRAGGTASAIFSLTAGVLLAADSVVSVWAAFGLSGILRKLTEIKTEMLRLSGQTKRQAGSEPPAKAAERLERLRSDLISEYRKINAMIKNFIIAHPKAYSKRFNEALSDLKRRALGKNGPVLKNWEENGDERGKTEDTDS